MAALLTHCSTRIIIIIIIQRKTHFSHHFTERTEKPTSFAEKRSHLASMGCKTLGVMRQFGFYTRNVRASASLLIILQFVWAKVSINHVWLDSNCEDFKSHHFICSEPKDNKKKTNPKCSNKARWVVSVSFNYTKQFAGDKRWGGHSAAGMFSWRTSFMFSQDEEGDEHRAAGWSERSVPLLGEFKPVHSS